MKKSWLCLISSLSDDDDWPIHLLMGKITTKKGSLVTFLVRVVSVCDKAKTSFVGQRNNSGLFYHYFVLAVLQAICSGVGRGFEDR